MSSAKFKSVTGLLIVRFESERDFTVPGRTLEAINVMLFQL